MAMATPTEDARKRVADLARNLRAAEKGAGRENAMVDDLDAAIAALDALETPVVYEVVGYVSSYGRREWPFVEIHGHDELQESVYVTIRSNRLLTAVQSRTFGRSNDCRFRVTITEIGE